MSTAAPVAWKLSAAGVALASVLTWAASTQLPPTPLVPAVDFDARWVGAPEVIDKRAFERRMITHVVRMLAELPADAGLDAFDVSVDAGFGLSIRHVQYVDCHVSLLYDHGTPARADAECVYGRDLWDWLGPAVQRQLVAAGFRVRMDPHVVRATRSVRHADYSATLARALGPLTPVHGTADELAAYETLTSLDALTCPLGAYDWSASPTKGGHARDVLVRAGRDDLLRNALRGPNPDGRAAAWEGLQTLGKAQDADRDVKQKLADEPALHERQGESCRLWTPQCRTRKDLTSYLLREM